MWRIIFCLFLLLFMCQSGLASQNLAALVRTNRIPDGTISAYEARKHIGEWATVCGGVAESRSVARQERELIILDFSKPFPNQHFTVVMQSAHRERLNRLSGEKRDRWICVTGKIESYEGKPQILIKEPSQLQSLCEVAARNPKRLSNEWQCVLDLYIGRCNPEDVCLVDCIAHRKAERIGGGCYHSCYAYTGIRWTRPQGVDECNEPSDPSTPSP